MLRIEFIYNYLLDNVIDTNYFTTFLQTADVTLAFSK